MTIEILGFLALPHLGNHRLEIHYVQSKPHLGIVASLRQSVRPQVEVGVGPLAELCLKVAKYQVWLCFFPSSPSLDYLYRKAGMARYLQYSPSNCLYAIRIRNSWHPH
jgi:hypothetical protein